MKQINKNKRKIIITLVTAVTIMVLFGALSFSASAAPAGVALSENGGTLTSGSYYLDGDLKLNNNISIQSGATVTIDLNGYALIGADGASWTAPKKEGSVITNKGGTLTIKDSRPEANRWAMGDDR